MKMGDIIHVAQTLIDSAYSSSFSSDHTIWQNIFSKYNFAVKENHLKTQFILLAT